MRRTNRVRLSDGEKAVLEAAKESEYDADVPYGTVIERACRQLLAESGDSGGVEL